MTKNNQDEVPELPLGSYEFYVEYPFFHDKDKCIHEWKKYIGFNEKYEFCTKCDSKKPYEEL